MYVNTDLSTGIASLFLTPEGFLRMSYKCFKNLSPQVRRLQSPENPISSPSPSSQVPMIVVFTKNDKTVKSFLLDLLSPANGKYTKLDIERLRPDAEMRARERYLKLKDAIVARGLRKARFAVLGGLALPNGGSDMFGS